MIATERFWLIIFLVAKPTLTVVFQAAFLPGVAQPVTAAAWYLGILAIVTVIVGVATSSLGSPLPYLSWLGALLLLIASGPSAWPQIVVGAVYYADLVIFAYRLPAAERHGQQPTIQGDDHAVVTRASALFVSGLHTATGGADPGGPSTAEHGCQRASNSPGRGQAA